MSVAEALIHPSSVIDPSAKIGSDVKIGPFCVVGAGVVLRDGVELVSQVALSGRTEIGENSKIYPFASVGHQPQDLKYSGEESRLVIGARAIVRECVTINPGTAGGNMETRIGDDCLLMANVHVAHDCILGNNVIVANSVAIAGHCTIGNFVNLGGLSGLHQYTRVGDHAFIGGHTAIGADVIPYGMAVGNRAKLVGLNLVGLKRRNFDREAIHQLRAAYRMIFAREGTLRERVDDAASHFAGQQLVQNVVDFIIAGGERSLCLPGNGNGTSDAGDA